MKNLFRAILLSLMFTTLAVAADKDPLFVNLTSDNTHRSLMAVTFSHKMQSKGHHLTVYLNDKGVLLASKKFPRYSQIQSKLADIIKNGGNVYICPVCMQEYGVEGENLLKGLTVGNANLLEKAVFQKNSKSISW